MDHRETGLRNFFFFFFSFVLPELPPVGMSFFFLDPSPCFIQRERAIKSWTAHDAEKEKKKKRMTTRQGGVVVVVVVVVAIA